MPLIVVLLVFSGCNAENFFDINSAMGAPVSVREQKDILNCVQDYMEDDFNLKYSLYKGKYHSCIIENFGSSDSQNENYALFFCSKKSNLNEIHILFLKKANGEWSLFNDIKYVGVDVEKVYIQDVDGDGNSEFAFILKVLGTKRDNVYTYKYSNGDVKKINIPQEFFNNFKDNV